jgi:hypothetical protein
VRALLRVSEDERLRALAALAAVEAKVRFLESENVQVSFLRERVRVYEERCSEYNLASQRMACEIDVLSRDLARTSFSSPRPRALSAPPIAAPQLGEVRWLCLSWVA